jgi:hypothetical protein
MLKQEKGKLVARRKTGAFIELKYEEDTSISMEGKGK